MAFVTGVSALSNAPITSLRRAAGAKDAAALLQLLDKLGVVDAASMDADCDESGRSPLHHACWRGSVSNVERLLDLGCDFDAWSTGEGPVQWRQQARNSIPRHAYKTVMAGCRLIFACTASNPVHPPSAAQASTRTARRPSSTPSRAAAMRWWSCSSPAAPARAF